MPDKYKSPFPTIIEEPVDDEFQAEQDEIHFMKMAIPRTFDKLSKDLLNKYLKNMSENVEEPLSKEEFDTLRNIINEHNNLFISFFVLRYKRDILNVFLRRLRKSDKTAMEFFMRYFPKHEMRKSPGTRYVAKKAKESSYAEIMREVEKNREETEKLIKGKPKKDNEVQSDI